MRRLKFLLIAFASLFCTKQAFAQMPEDEPKPSVSIMLPDGKNKTGTIVIQEDSKYQLNKLVMQISSDALCNLEISSIGGSIGSKKSWKSINISDLESIIGNITFIPKEDANSSNGDKFSVSINVSSINNDFENNLTTINFEVTQTNDLARFSGIDLICQESGFAMLSSKNLVASGNYADMDPDIKTGQQVIQQQVVTIRQLPTKGKLSLENKTLGIGDKIPLTSFSQIKYTNTLDDSSMGEKDAFAISVNDGEADSEIYTISINISPINKEPIVDYALKSIFQGATRPLDFDIDWRDKYDFDNLGDCQFRILSIEDNSIGTFFLDKNSNGIFDSGEQIAGKFDSWTKLSDYDLNKIYYTHFGEEPKDGDYSKFTIEVKDAGGALGIENALTATQEIVVNITPNNDDPIITHIENLLCAERTNVILTTDILTIEDSDCNNPTELVFTVCGSSYNYGRFEKLSTFQNADASQEPFTVWAEIRPGQAFTYQDIIDNKIRYISQKGVTGDQQDALKLKLKDSRYGYDIYSGESHREGGWRGFDENGNYNYNGPITEFYFYATIQDGGADDGGSGESMEYLIKYDFSRINPNNNLSVAGHFMEGEKVALNSDNIKYSATILLYDKKDSKYENMLGYQEVAPSSIIFTITQEVENAKIYLASDPSNESTYREIGVMNQFTQDDINNGRLIIEHDGDDNHTVIINYLASIGISNMESNCKDITDQQLILDFGNTNDLPQASGKATCQESGQTSELIFNITDEDGIFDNDLINDLYLKIGKNPSLLGKLLIKIGDSEYAPISNYDVWYSYNRDTKEIFDQEGNSIKFIFVHDDSEPLVSGFETSFPIWALDINPWEESESELSNHISEQGNFVITILDINNKPMIAKIPVNVSIVDATNPKVSQTIEGQTVSTNNVHSSIEEAGMTIITSDYLYAVDKDNTEIQRQYIIEKTPQYGAIYLDGKILGQKSTFSQEDINNNRLSYQHNGKAPINLASKNAIDGIAQNWNIDGQESEFWYNDYMSFVLSDAVSGHSEIKYFLFRITNLNENPELKNPAKHIDVFGDGNNFVEVPKAFDITDPDIVEFATGVKDEIYAKVIATDKNDELVSAYTIKVGSCLPSSLKVKSSAGMIEFYGTIKDVNTAISCLEIACSADRNVDDDRLKVIVNDQLRNTEIESWPTITDKWNGGDKCRVPNTMVENYILMSQSNLNDNPVVDFYPAKLIIDEDSKDNLISKNTQFVISDVDNFDRQGYSLQINIKNIKYVNDEICTTCPPSISLRNLENISLKELNEELNKITVSPFKDFNGSFDIEYIVSDFGHADIMDGNQINFSTHVVVTPINDNVYITSSNKVDLTKGNFYDFKEFFKIGDNADLEMKASDMFTLTITADSKYPNDLIILEDIPTTGSISKSGTIEQIQNLLNTFKYEIPDDDINDDKEHVVTISIDDMYNGGSSEKNSVVSKKITINVSNINDAPQFTFGNQKWSEEEHTKNIDWQEDQEFKFENENLIQYNDDDFGNRETITIKVENGKINTTQGLDNNLVITDTKKNINKLLSTMKFVPSENYFGIATITIQIDDLGNTGEGGSKQATRYIKFKIENVNDRPSLDEKEIYISDINEDIQDNQNIGSSISGQLFAFNDQKDNELASLPKYFAIVGNTANPTSQGKWQVFVDGSWQDIPQDASTSNAYIFSDGTLVRFKAVENYNGSPKPLTVKFSDGSISEENCDKLIGTAIDFANDNSPWTLDNANIKVKVLASNDAPVLLVDDNIWQSSKTFFSKTINEDESFVFEGESLISYQDLDDNGGNQEITISLTNGTALIDGLEISQSQTLKGTKAELNSKLESLIFVPSPNYFGQASLSILVNDKGNTGIGGEKTILRTAYFNIENVNDQPTINANTIELATIKEDSPNPTGEKINALDFGYSDAKDNDKASDAKYFAVVGNNANSAQGTWQVFIDGTWKDIPTDASNSNAYIFDINVPVRFNPAEDYFGNPGNLTIKFSDGSKKETSANSMNAAQIDYSLDTDPWTNQSGKITIKVSPQNDAPVVSSEPTDVVVLETDAKKEGKIDIASKVIDVDNDASQIKINSINVSGQTSNTTMTVEGSYGTISINPDGSYTYIPNKEKLDKVAENTEFVLDKFDYTVSDGTATSQTPGQIVVKIINLANADIVDSQDEITNSDHVIYIPIKISGNLTCENTKLDIKAIDNTAKSGIDYQINVNSISVNQGDQEILIPVTIKGNNTPQSQKDFEIEISARNPQEINVVSSTATISLNNSVSIAGNIILENSNNYQAINDNTYTAPTGKTILLVGDDLSVFDDFRDNGSYQWQINIGDGNGFVDIPNQTGKNLSTDIPDQKGTYEYRRVATWGNGLETKISNTIGFNSFYSLVEINYEKLIYGNSALDEDLVCLVSDQNNQDIIEFGNITWYVDDQRVEHGTMLTPGNHTVVAEFTPNNSQQYKSGISKTYNIFVDKKQLYATPSTQEWKYEDGNTTCKVTSMGELEGVVTRLNKVDDVQINTCIANYDNAEIGQDKEVVVVYTLKGEHADYYIAPKDYNTVGDIRTKEIEITGIHQEKYSYCQGDQMEIIFKVKTGIINQYKLEFDYQSGLEDVDWTSYQEGNISYQIGEYQKFGHYTATLTVRNIYGTQKEYQIPFALGVPNQYVVSKFHDVVLVNNHEDQFVAYQWFKGEDKNNLILQEGKDKQFWQDKSGDNQGLEGWYMARVITTNGDTLTTCPVFYDDLRISNRLQVAVYPNPAIINNDVNIQLKDISDSDLEKAEIMIYSNNGSLAKRFETVERDNHTTLPQGEYIGNVRVGNQVKSFKIIVK